MSLESIAYVSLSEKDWEEKTKFLYGHGFKRHPVSNWGPHYDTIIIYSDSKVLSGNSGGRCGDRKNCSWDEVLEFIGVKPLPDKWFVKVSRDTWNLLKRLDNEVKGNSREVKEVSWNNGGWKWVSTEGWYFERQYSEVTLEQVIKWILTKPVKKWIEVSFSRDEIIVEGITYVKKL